jgi:5-methylcytosine-specific restriction protein A
MPRAFKVCATAGCPELVPSGWSSRCEAHNREAEQRRGSAASRGYGTRWHNGPRKACLLRDPLCVCTDAGHGHDGRTCIAQSTVADHWPESRRTLVARAVPDPDALHRLRGLCGSCHSKATADNPDQQGGWNRRP